MQPPALNVVDIVLLGAGAAHLEVLRRFARCADPDIRVTLVASQPETPCPGMLPALVRGDGAASGACIDLTLLTATAGARLIVAETMGLDLAERTLLLAGRPPLPFDLLSADLHGESIMPEVCDACIPASPPGRFHALLPALEAALPNGARLAILGSRIEGPDGGTWTDIEGDGAAAAGSKGALPSAHHGGIQAGTTPSDRAAVELALALAKRFGGRLRLLLVSEAAEPLAAAPLPARRAVRAALVDAGVELASAVRAGALTNGRLVLSDGSFLATDVALWVGETRAPALFAAAGLACDAAGRVRVNAGRRSVSHSFIFAAGDCAAPAQDRAAGPHLWANLCRAAKGRRLKRSLHRWLPPRFALVMLDLGGGRAVAWSHGLALAGEAVWRCMAWLNQSRFRAYGPDLTTARHRPRHPTLWPGVIRLVRGVRRGQLD